MMFPMCSPGRFSPTAYPFPTIRERRRFLWNDPDVEEYIKRLYETALEGSVTQSDEVIEVDAVWRAEDYRSDPDKTPAPLLEPEEKPKKTKKELYHPWPELSTWDDL